MNQITPWSFKSTPCINLPYNIWSDSDKFEDFSNSQVVGIFAIFNKFFLTFLTINISSHH